MKIRIVKDWKHYKRGRILTPGDGVANVLIARGIAEKVSPRRKTKKK